uniref:helix-turn-helix domain-containing protein n=1 Tax=Streptococcus pluranimalium TaxID=82348 RepID=UPI003F68C74F
MSKFASRLKDLRKKNGYTQADIAKEIGITQGAYQKWETGSREPSFENLIKLAKILDTTPDYLLGYGSTKANVTFFQRSEEQNLKMESSLGTRLKYLRKKKKFTQVQLSSSINVKQGSYANWENGKREPSLENVVRLAKLFGVTTDYLLGRYK